MSVTMSPEELDQFLGEKLTMSLITINPDGTPLPAPLWYVNRGDVMYVGTMRKTQKVKNILRDPRVTALVEDGEVYLRLRAAIVRGRAEIVEDAGELAWFNAEMAVKYADRRAAPQALPEATRRYYDNPRVVIKVVPERVRSWNNAKIRTAAAT